MGLEIQQAANSMINSAASIQQQQNEQHAKAIRVAMNAVQGFMTGGPAGAVAGAVGGLAKEASNSGTAGAQAQQALSGVIQNHTAQAPDTQSPQAQAASVAETRVNNDLAAKKAQSDRLEERQRALSDDERKEALQLAGRALS